MHSQTNAVSPNSKEHREMVDCYQKYLSTGRKEAGPREAHLFALAMAHKGITYGRSVSDIVVTLAGELPPYWPKVDLA